MRGFAVVGGLALVGAALYWLYKNSPEEGVPAPAATRANVTGALPGVAAPSAAVSDYLAGRGGGSPGGGHALGFGENSPVGGQRPWIGTVPVCYPVNIGAGQVTQCSDMWVEIPRGHAPLQDV